MPPHRSTPVLFIDFKAKHLVFSKSRPKFPLAGGAPLRTAVPFLFLSRLCESHCRPLPLRTFRSSESEHHRDRLSPLKSGSCKSSPSARNWLLIVFRA